MKTLAVLLMTFFVVDSYADNCVFTPESDCINNLRVYMDREGNLYPPSDLYKFDVDEFYDPTSRGFDLTSRLSEYFKNDRPALHTVCDKLNISRDFETLQDHLLQAYANKINQEAKDGNKIVFIIHGFNNNQLQAATSYSLLRDQLRKGDNLTIVEVYWDGLHKLPPKIWFKAQPNSVYAGLGLRKILNKVNADVEIALLTHSLGASVATQALFNVCKWTDRNDFQNKLDELSSKIPTPPQKSITLCMFAPAIPGVNTFDGLERTVVNNTSQHIKKIIIGYNNKDRELKKRILNASKYLGSTSLGSDADGEVAKTKETILGLYPSIFVEGIDLSRKPIPKDHSIKGYILADRFPEFLAHLY